MGEQFVDRAAYRQLAIAAQHQQQQQQQQLHHAALANNLSNPSLSRQSLVRMPGEAECMDASKSKYQRLRQQAQGSPDYGIYAFTTNYSLRLSQSLYQHQQDGKFCDFTLKLDSGREIPIHKMVLSSTSTYFSCLFQSQMLETKQGFVHLRGMGDSAMLEVIKYMYTGKFYLSRINIREMLEACSHLQVELALVLCANYLISIITNANCVEIYNIADRYSLAQVKASAFNHMRLMFTQLVDDQLLLLTEQQIIEVVKSDALLCTSEWDVFVKVEKWLKSIEDEAERLRLTIILMKFVRFSLMTGDELVSKVSRVEMMKNEPCSRILTEAKDYHIVVQSQPILQTQRTRVRHADIIYMAICQDTYFSAFPLLSPNYRLVSDRPVELRKPPINMISAEICYYNNFLYMCGGVHDKVDTTISTARCYRYDPRMDTWQEIACLNESRQRFDLQVIGDYMFAMGGWDESEASKTYEVYDFRKDEWKKHYLPTGYHQPTRHATVVVAQSIYVSGGSMGAYTSNAMLQYIHDERAPGTLLIRMLPPMHKARKKHRMFSHNKKIFVLGGLATSIEVFDIVTEQWTLYEGFAESLGLMTKLIGVCALDTTRLILVSYRESASCCMLLNLEKDPDKEKDQFIKKLNADPKIPINITTVGTQIWLPALDAVVGKRDTLPMLPMNYPPQPAVSQM